MKVKMKKTRICFGSFFRIRVFRLYSETLCGFILIFITAAGLKLTEEADLPEKALKFLTD